MMNINIKRSDCVYTSCYCEENVWKLCEYISKTHENCLNDCFAVFISNDHKMIPLWKQKAGDKHRDYLCVWDYHVIMIYAPKADSAGSGRALVYDMDSMLSFPCDFQTYSELTFRDEESLRSEYHRKYRVIEAQIYLTGFASNRSHMRRPDGTWIKDPPLYDCIRTNECDHNLHQFIAMDSHNQFNVGSVFDINQLNQRFATNDVSVLSLN